MSTKPKFEVPWPYECVTWVDSAQSFEGWSSEDDVEAPFPLEHLCQSAGWIIKENDHGILIAASVGYTEGHPPQFGTAMTIPHVCILDRRRFDA